MGGYDWRVTRLGDDVLLWVLRDVSERLRHQQDTFAVHEGVVQSLTAATIGRELGADVVADEGVAAALDAAKMVSRGARPVVLSHPTTTRAGDPL